MKKLLALTLALCMLLFALSACGGKTKTGEIYGSEPSPSADAGDRLPDFTVETADGGSFTLSQALATHKLVLIKLWATWCGYCGMDFVSLNEVYADYADRVAVIALSIEPTDTPEKILAYARSNGYDYPMASAIGTGLESYADDGVPVSILVDRDLEPVSVGLGAKPNGQAFATLFDAYLNASPEKAEPVDYAAFCVDESGAGVAGCTVTFCNGALCVPVITDENGAAEYSGPPAEYTVKVAGLPDGRQVSGDAEKWVGPAAAAVIFVVTEAQA